MTVDHRNGSSTPPVSADAISPVAMKRALRRAHDGNSLNVHEIEVLLHARGSDLDALMSYAARSRDAGLASAGLGNIITYSKKVFIPITHLCRDRCHYCTFVQPPHKLRAAGKGLYLEPEEIIDIARQGAALGCKEVLFTLGDRPEDRWPEAAQWLDEHGYNSTLEYVRAMAIKVLEETGLLPHLNPGIMTWNELASLKPVAPSMGIMLETTSERLYTEKGQAHYGSPDKDPRVRLQCLTDAGRHAIPMTTGLLIGIGEDFSERAHSLMALRKLHKDYGHLQEIIIQNFRAKNHTAMALREDADLEEYLAAVACARLVMGPSVCIQAPPNLVSTQECSLLLQAGIDDWGGVSPLTPDHVNPERPWPQIDALARVTSESGFTLVERLTIHREYILKNTPWVDPRLFTHIHALAQPDTALANPDAVIEGRPWQEPDEMWESSGRTDLDTDIDVQGRFTVNRSDMNSAFGDWDSVREKVHQVSGLENSSASTHISSEVRTALRLAEKDPAGLTDAQYTSLAYADGTDLEAVARFADELRKDANGDVITYIVNRNINFTNICYTGCRFCAFAQRKGDADAFTLSTDEVAERAYQAHLQGATEVCMQGGIDPQLPVTGYSNIVSAVKQRVPSMHVHAYSPMEIVQGASKSGSTIKDWLLHLKEAGLDSIPGTAAEILDDEIRWILTKGKLPTESWIDVVTTAHSVGIRSSSTMMYGHVDQPYHWVSHLNKIRAIQDLHGGFTEFVLLPFVHHSAPLYLAGAARPGPTKRENQAAHALARIMLHGRIPNIQTSWVKLGAIGSQVMLNSGANDLGGTLMEETISRMAGADHGSAKTVEEMIEIASGIGRPAQQRTTDYTYIDSTVPKQARNIPLDLITL